MRSKGRSRREMNKGTDKGHRGEREQRMAPVKPCAVLFQCCSSNTITVLREFNERVGGAGIMSCVMRWTGWQSIKRWLRASSPRDFSLQCFCEQKHYLGGLFSHRGSVWCHSWQDDVNLCTNDDVIARKKRSEAFHLWKMTFFTNGLLHFLFFFFLFFFFFSSLSLYLDALNWMTSLYSILLEGVPNDDVKEPGWWHHTEPLCEKKARPNNVFVHKNIVN